MWCYERPKRQGTSITNIILVCACTFRSILFYTLTQWLKYNKLTGKFSAEGDQKKKKNLKTNNNQKKKCFMGLTKLSWPIPGRSVQLAASPLYFFTPYRVTYIFVYLLAFIHEKLKQNDLKIFLGKGTARTGQNMCLVYYRVYVSSFKPCLRTPRVRLMKVKFPISRYLILWSETKC